MEPDGSQFIYVLIMVILMLLKMLCSACEFAVNEINASKLAHDAEKNKRCSGLLKLLEKPYRLAITFLTGRAILSAFIAFAAVMTSVCVIPDGRFKIIGVILSVLGAAIVSAAVTDIFPRKLIGNNAESFALKVVMPIKGLMIVLAPFSTLVYGVSVVFCAVFRVQFMSKRSVVTEEEILMMVDAGNQTGVIEQSQREMINNIFEFGGSVVSEVMTHRTDLCAVDVETKIGDVVYLAINEGYSRIPIYEDTIDSIIGILYVKDLLCLVGCEHSEDFTVRQFMRKAKYIPETCNCSDALEEMTKEKCQAAVVVDEYGGTAGMITMEDLLEEIVGNIQDEYDDEKAEILKIDEGVYTLSGDINPEDAAEVLGIELPADHNYDTMSAFIVDLLGRIPHEDETPSVVYNDVEFTVLLTEDNWVSRIKAACINSVDENTAD
jgi:putative hemolysin